MSTSSIGMLASTHPGGAEGRFIGSHRLGGRSSAGLVFNGYRKRFARTYTDVRTPTRGTLAHERVHVNGHCRREYGEG